MTPEERNAIISNIAEEACDQFDLKDHLRALYRDTVEKLESSNDDFLRDQADFYGVEIETSSPD